MSRKSKTTPADTSAPVDAEADAATAIDETALLRDEPPADVRNHLPPGPAQLMFEQLRASPLNPRKAFDEEGLAELAASVAEHGLLQNLVVRPIEDEPYMYWIVAGERRWRAVQLARENGTWPAGQRLPVQIRDMTDGEHAALALIENLQRRDLNPIEEAEGLKALMEATGMGTAEVATRIGFTQRYVQIRLQLLSLTDRERAAVAKGDITLEAARRRLANKPEPLTFTPDQKIAFLEIAQHIAKGGNGDFWHEEQVDFSAAAELERTGAAGVVADLTTTWPSSNRGAATVIRLNYGARRALDALVGGVDLDLEAITAALEAAYVEFGVRPAEGFNYLTSWLCPEFRIDPEALAELEARRVEWTKDEEQREKLAIERKARAAEQAARIGDVDSLTLNFASAEDRPTRMAAALEAVGHPLPWTYVSEGESGIGIRDATGGWVNLDSGPLTELDVLNRLVMAAINTAAGFDPAVEAPVASEADTSDDADQVDDDEDDPDADPYMFGDELARQIRETLAETAGDDEEVLEPGEAA